MLLLLAVTRFITCSVTSLQAIGGDAVKRITKTQVKFSVANVDHRGYAETRAQAEHAGEGWDRQQLLQPVNHQRRCVYNCMKPCATGGEVNLFQLCSRWRMRLKSGCCYRVEQTQEDLQNASCV